MKHDYVRNLDFWGQIDEIIKSNFIFPAQNIRSKLKISDKDDINNFIYSMLSKQDRKTYAVNFTKYPISNFLVQTYGEQKKIESIVDPFCGTGRLISSYLANNRDNDFPLICLNDILLVPLLIAYYNVLRHFERKRQDYQNIIVIWGDGFQLQEFLMENKLPTQYDLVLMNPPFTRRLNLTSSQLKSLNDHFIENRNRLKGQPGLHIYALFAAFDLLKQKGNMCAILPASTIISDYSQQVQTFLISSFNDIKLYISKKSKSLSEGSDVRELIISGTKNGRSSKFIQFFDLAFDKVKSFQITLKSKVDINQAKLIKNWLIFFHSKRVNDLLMEITSSRLIGSANDLDFNIKRGIELYGPNFFFFPNRFSKLVLNEEKSKINLEDLRDNRVYSIPKSALRKILRRPGLYQIKITPRVNEWVVLFNPEILNQNWAKFYIERNADLAFAAQSKFGDNWLFHTTKQVDKKNPRGYVFLPDKISLSSTGILAYYQSEPTLCTKNFYVFSNLDAINSKILAAWFCSSLYLFLYLNYRREIGGTYGRMQISDLRISPIFPNLQKLDKNHTKIILSVFDDIKDTSFAPILNKNHFEKKRKLDQAWFKALKINNLQMLDKIYRLIADILNELKNRD